MDYTILFKKCFACPKALAAHYEWDLFISAFNASDRVNLVFGEVTATHKHWLMHREYGYSAEEHPPGRVFSSFRDSEADFVLEYVNEFAKNAGVDLMTTKLCIDITGFMRPELMFMIRYLAYLGVGTFDVIYSEPMHYKQKERTTFSDGAINEVRQVNGFEGVINPDTSRDVLIIGSGYDDRLIAEVAEDKDKAEKIQIFGLPSLRADMYQQNVLRVYQAADAVGESHLAERNTFFAPANDPFVTAQVLSELVAARRKEVAITNLYLSPLATKPQALGFVLYYIGECVGEPVSVVFPFRAKYSRETSQGLSRIWVYTVEFPLA